MIDFLISIDNQAQELDSRQPWKVRYRLSTVLFLVFVCQLAGITSWIEMEDFIEMNTDILGRYVDLSDGCPSHDTLERVMGLVNQERLSELKLQMEHSVSDIPEFQSLIAS